MKKIILFGICSLLSLSAQAASYPAEGYFGNENALFACVIGAEKGMQAALQETSALELFDYAFTGRVRYVESGNPTYPMGTYCATVLNLNGEVEKFSEKRVITHDRDERKATLKGADATVEKACAEAEKAALHWSQYGGPIDWTDWRVFSSRMLGRTYEQGREWGTGIPWATCTIKREFSSVLIKNYGGYSETDSGVTPKDACSKALKTIESKAKANCESKGLFLHDFTPGGQAIEQPRSGLVVCRTSADFMCFEE